MKTEDILNEREKTHGDFEEFAKVRVSLARSLGLSKRTNLTAAQSIAASMILTKLARIVCGDPNFADHWDDIAGYAMLGKGENESRANPDAAINFWEEGSNKPKKDYQVKEDINCESCGVVLREDSWALVLPGDNKYYCRKCASIKSFY